MRLPIGMRHLLLATSVLGVSFSAGAAAAMLSPAPLDEVQHLLATACGSELLGQTTAPPVAEPEYRFLQAQLCDAAYALLTDEDRRLLHLRALHHLQETSRVTPSVLAEHAVRAGEMELALAYFIQAAELALHTSCLEDAMRLGERALMLNPKGESRGRVLAIQLLAQVWSRMWQRVGPLGNEALSLLPVGSAMWCKITGPLGIAELMGGQSTSSEQLADRLCAIEPSADALANYVESMALLLGMFSLRCMRAVADKLSARLVQLADNVPSDELLIHGWVALSRCEFLRHVSPNPQEQLRLAERGARLLTLAGDKRTQIFAQNFWGQVLSECGEQARGEQVLRDSLGVAVTLQEPYSVVHAKLHLAALLCGVQQSQKQSEALQIVEDLLRIPDLSPSFQGWALSIAAEVCLRQGQSSRAVKLARESLACAQSVPLRVLLARAVLILGLLAQEDVDGARSEAVSVLQQLESLGSGGYAESTVLLAIICAFRRAGDSVRAGELLWHAVRQIKSRAQSLSSIEANDRFLYGIPVHAELLRFAESYD